MWNLYVVSRAGSLSRHAVHMLSLCEYYDLCDSNLSEPLVQWLPGLLVASKYWAWQVRLGFKGCCGLANRLSWVQILLVHKPGSVSCAYFIDVSVFYFCFQTSWDPLSSLAGVVFEPTIFQPREKMGNQCPLPFLIHKKGVEKVLNMLYMIIQTSAN